MEIVNNNCNTALENSDSVRNFKLEDNITNPIKFNVITAMDENMGIGKDYVLPWHIPSEFEYFLNMTSKPRPDSHGNKRRNVIIIGRKTWETMDQLTNKPLPNSVNIVMSQSEETEKEISKYTDTIKCTSIEEAVWVLGGAEIYRLAIQSPYFHRLYITHIHNTYDCDSYFPKQIKLHEFDVLEPHEIEDDRVPCGVQVDKSTGATFQVKVYQRKSVTL